MPKIYTMQEHMHSKHTSHQDNPQSNKLMAEFPSRLVFLFRVLHEPIYNQVDICGVLAWYHETTDLSIGDRHQVPTEQQNINNMTHKLLYTVSNC